MSMRREEDRLEQRCPVCGRGLPPSPVTRRCPGCGARTLWQEGQGPLALPVALFNGRLCGIIIGVQVGLVIMLTVAAGQALAAPVVATCLLAGAAGYVVGGAIALRISPGNRRGYLVVMLSIIAGLTGALIAGIVGIGDPVALLGIAVALGVVSSPLISRAVWSWTDSGRQLP